MSISDVVIISAVRTPIGIILQFVNLNCVLIENNIYFILYYIINPV